MDIRLGRKLEERLEAVARQRGRSPAEVLRELIAKALSEASVGNGAPPNGAGQTLYDIAVECGSLGMADDLPRDLSTNPDHFDGFGRG